MNTTWQEMLSNEQVAGGSQSGNTTQSMLQIGFGHFRIVWGIQQGQTWEERTDAELAILIR